MHPWLTALGWAVINSCWQAGLLWLLGKGMLSAPGFRMARHRASLQISLIFISFAWFVYTLISAVSLNQTEMAGAVPVPALSYQTNLIILGYLPVLSFIYLVLLLIPVFRLIRNLRYVQIIRRQGLTRMPAEWRIYVEQIRLQLGIARQVQIWISDFVSSPVTIGFLKPMILIPAAALSSLSPDQLEAVLLHELAHIRRLDFILNLLVSMIRAILYFNPFIRMMARELERDREMSCDELVLQYRYNAIQYATALLLLEKESHNRPLILHAAGKSPDFLHRIETILGKRQPRRISARRMAGSLFTIAVILLFKFLIAVPEKRQTNADYVWLAPAITPIAPSNDLPVPGIHAGSTALHRQPVETELHPEITSAPVQLNPQIRPEDIHTVSYLENMKIALSKNQEAQVKKAMEESKKVLENLQWKSIERKIADVLSTEEKARLREEYHKAVGHINWKEWENKLREAYHQVNWNNVNEELSRAVNQVRIDSLQTVYSAIEAKLNRVQAALEENEISGIPDSDISLKLVEEKKKQADELLRSLRNIRNPKVVHL